MLEEIFTLYGLLCRSGVKIVLLPLESQHLSQASNFSVVRTLQMPQLVKGSRTGATHDPVPLNPGDKRI